MIRKLTVLACALILLVSGTTFAAGFNIYEAGAKATALGGAFTATADDGSAIFYNSAGLAFLEGSGMSLNLMPILPTAEFTGATMPDGSYDTAQTESAVFPIPGMYYYKNTGDLSYGFGLYAPFGMGVAWEDPETSPGRQISYDVNLQTVYFTPAIAMKMTDNIALSVGADIAHTAITLSKFTAIPFGGEMDMTNVIDAELTGDSDINITPVVSCMIKGLGALDIGIMYHHEKTMNIAEGELIMTNVAPAALAPAIDAQIAGLGGDTQYADTEFKLPHMLSLGAAWQATEKTRVEFNAVHFGWEHFDEIYLDFENDYLDQHIEENYEDVWQYRVGVTYAMDEKTNILLGYVDDKTPQPVGSVNPMLPDADRKDYSVGVEYKYSDNMTFVGSYMSVNFDERSNVVDGVHGSYETDVNPAGSYDSFANIFGVAVNYKF
jgi:long-chain fatty acid transport protein